MADNKITVEELDAEMRVLVYRAINSDLRTIDIIAAIETSKLALSMRLIGTAHQQGAI